MKKILVAGIAAAASCGAPALAADLPVKAPARAYVAPAPVFTWTGCYIGANVGGGWSHKSFDFEGFDEGSHSADGWVGGGQIGCDYQFANNWLIGIQGMWDGASLKGSNTVPLFPNETWTTKIRSFATVDGRLGYLFNPATLFYGKAGIGWVNDQFTFTNGSFSSSANNTRSGFDLGVGLSWMFAAHWDFFVEYDHIFLGTKDVTFPGLPVDAQIKQNFDKVLVGIDYRFDMMGKAPVVSAKY
jgi:outer membrane immunogenic protein